MLAVSAPFTFFSGLILVLVGIGVLCSGIVEWCRLDGNQFEGEKHRRWHLIIMPLLVASFILLAIGAALMHSVKYGS